MSHLEILPPNHHINLSEIFDRQGISEENRNPDDFYIYKVREELHSPFEVYAVPKTIPGNIVRSAREGNEDNDYSGVDFTMLENGSITHPKAKIHKAAKIGQRVIVFTPSVIAKDVSIGPGSEISADVIRRNTYLSPGVTVKEGADVGPNVGLEKGVTIGAYDVLAEGTWIDQDTELEGLVETGYRSRIGANNVIKTGAKVGDFAVTEERVVLGEGATMEDNSRVQAGKEVLPLTTIQRGQHVESAARYIGRTLKQLVSFPR